MSSLSAKLSDYRQSYGDLNKILNGSQENAFDCLIDLIDDGRELANWNIDPRDVFNVLAANGLLPDSHEQLTAAEIGRYHKIWSIFKIKQSK